MTDTKKSVAYALVTIFFWSTVATAFKIALRHGTIPQVLFIAALTSFLIFGIYCAFTGFSNVLKQTKKDLLNSAIMGFINPFAYYLILFKAYDLLPAQIAQPLNLVWPLALALLAVPILKQKLASTTLTSLAICFIGALLISSQGKLHIFEESNPTGIGLALFSSTLWALYWLLNVKDNRSTGVKLFTNFGFSLLYLLILSLFTKDFYSFSLKGAASSIYIGAFEMGLSFLFWLKALEYAKSAAKIGLIAYLVPFFSLFFIHFVVGEEIRITTIVGLILIILGVVYQQWSTIFNKERN